MRFYSFSLFLDKQMKLCKEDIDSIISHMSNDIVNKEKSALDEFVININNSVSYSRVYKTDKVEEGMI